MADLHNEDAIKWCAKSSLRTLIDTSCEANESDTFLLLFRSACMLAKDQPEGSGVLFVTLSQARLDEFTSVSDLTIAPDNLDIKYCCDEKTLVLLLASLHLAPVYCSVVIIESFTRLFCEGSLGESHDIAAVELSFARTIGIAAEVCTKPSTRALLVAGIVSKPWQKRQCVRLFDNLVQFGDGSFRLKL
eukprot:m.600292 g.600292  ORF g.600292 m.600292 type:complete len:189 (-) comp22430_c1_seq2:1993-2559(-)